MRNCLLLCCLLSSTLHAQTIERVQRPLITKTTATWCPPCGGWGWDLFENLVEDNSEDAILMATHYSGDLTTATGEELSDAFGASGQPQFFVDGQRQSANSGSSAAARTAVRDYVSSTGEALVGANVIVEDNSGTYTATVNVQFFEAATGTYHASVYAVEDGVINSQASRGSNAVHKRVLRGALGAEGTFGREISTGTAVVGETLVATFEGELSAIGDLNNVTWVVVIWQKMGDDFTFVNASDAVAMPPSSTQKFASEEVKLTSFSESGMVLTTLQLTSPLEDLTFELIDANGRVLSEQRHASAPFGKTRYEWNGVELPTGYYAVRMRSEGRQVVAPVLVR